MELTQGAVASGTIVFLVVVGIAMWKQVFRPPVPWTKLEMEKKEEPQGKEELWNP